MLLAMWFNNLSNKNHGWIYVCTANWSTDDRILFGIDLLKKAYGVYKLIQPNEIMETNLNIWKILKSRKYLNAVCP